MLPTMHPLLMFISACQHASFARLYKLADTAVIKPKIETFVFTPDGRLYVKREKDYRRLSLPSIAAQRVPYEDGVRFVPSTGVDEPGVHGYDIVFHYADTDEPFARDLEGYETVTPEEALRELYAAVGKSENRMYRDIYRARIRALLRLLKKRRKAISEASEVQGQTLGA